MLDRRNIERDGRACRGFAVRERIGEGADAVLANRGIIGKLLGRAVKVQRTREVFCKIRNGQCVAVHVVVVFQNAEGAAAAIKNIDLVIHRNRRILNRIDHELEAVAGLRFAVADGQRNRHRSVCVRRGCDLYLAGAVAVVDDRHTIRGSNVVVTGRGND